MSDGKAAPREFDFSGPVEVRRRAEEAFRHGSEAKDIPSAQEIGRAMGQARRLQELADREATAREKGHLREAILLDGSAQELEASDRRAEECRRQAAIGKALAERLKYLMGRVEKLEMAAEIPDLLDGLPELVERTERARQVFEAAKAQLHGHGLRLTQAYESRPQGATVRGVDPDLIWRGNRAMGDPSMLLAAPVVEWKGPDDPPVPNGRGGWQHPPQQSEYWQRWWSMNDPLKAATGAHTPTPPPED